MERARERDHLDGRDGGVPALVALLGAGTLDRLLDRLGGQHAKNDRHSGGMGCRGEAAGGLSCDVVEVGVLPRMTAPSAMIASSLLGRGEAARDEGKLPRPRDTDHGHVRLGSSRAA